ncbi:hypothetical protein H2200_005124 [Cladophialophora chaetospira]|uniref:F-box domain-containing protein n=1 Tax=Cladophialophora chaetospira TaxID=386627 RepID=A0AA38XBI3_9EURO|nr:hypothetical protein H2200_005124 [Cladophialophora chaetospira]
MYANHAPFERHFPNTASQSHVPSRPYHDQTAMGAPAMRTTSSPASVPSRTSRHTIEPVFSIRATGASWKKLPSSVLAIVLDHLRSLHLGPTSSSCVTCYMRDLTSIQLTCKAWFSDAQRVLYTNIQIVGQEDPSLLQKWKLSRAARLIRLRSTLRSKPLLAALVKTMHVPDPNMPLYHSNGDPNPEYDAYICTLASVVMTCPNLEALMGFYCFYNHTFDRLTHALSTRTKLRQHAWIIAENDDVAERSQRQLPPGLLDENQTYQFTLYHDRWKQLETLLFCSPGGLGVIEHELFIRVLHSLPALRNLCISSFDPDDFHDLTLLSLPPWVTTLRLEECLGVTDTGLTKWAASPNARQIIRLSLLHQNITSLLTLSKIFASMERLAKFVVVQNDVAPSLPNDMRKVMVHPILASKSLQFLHWDISHPRAGGAIGSDDSSPEGGPTTPNMHLAFSISHRGFPKLKKLRAPRDTSPLGILQSVCQPIEDGITLPKDTSKPYRYQHLRRSCSLRAARLRAQRINAHTLGSTTRSNAPELQQPPTTDHLSVPQKAQKSNSDTSTSTMNSIGTSASRGSVPSNRTSGQTPVSPLSTSPDNFSPLAPDDGIISPIAADQDQMYQSRGDWNKQAVTGPQRSKRKEVPKPESMCRCTPSPIGNRDSVCLCEVRDVPKVEEIVSPPPRSLFRPPSVRVNDQVTRRFPSLARRPVPQIRPFFYLRPDVPGYDGNGGLIGWAELLRISEKTKASRSSEKEPEVHTQNPGTSNGEDIGEDGSEDAEHASADTCTGSWARRTLLQDQVSDLPVIKKILSANSATSDKSGKSANARSKSKSSSRLSLAIGTKVSDKPAISKGPSQGHVGRPRGGQGLSVNIGNFF